MHRSKWFVPYTKCLPDLSQCSFLVAGSIECLIWIVKSYHKLQDEIVDPQRQSEGLDVNLGMPCNFLMSQDRNDRSREKVKRLEWSCLTFLDYFGLPKKVVWYSFPSCPGRIRSCTFFPEAEIWNRSDLDPCLDRSAECRKGLCRRMHRNHITH